MQDADRSWLVVPAAGEDDSRRSVLEHVAARPVVAATLAVGGVLAALVAGLVLATTAVSPRLDLSGVASRDAGSADAVASAGGTTGGALVVEVAGAVRVPGLYRLPGGSRVGDAVSAAGGFAPTVDAALVARDLNLAAPLSDGQKIVVAARGAGPGGPPSPAASGLVDLNHASEAELDGLPGIGPVTARKIIESRSERPFRDPKELLDRKLIGERTWEKLRDLVTAD